MKDTKKLLQETKMPWGKKGRVRFKAVELENWQDPEMNIDEAHNLIREKQRWKAGETALRLQALQVITNHTSDLMGMDRVPVKAFNSLLLSTGMIMGYENEEKRDFVGVNQHFMGFPKTMADTVIHEQRHNWQHAALGGKHNRQHAALKIDHGLSKKELKRIRNNRGIYNGKPREVDARDHARSYMRKHNLGKSLVTITNDLLSPITTIKRAVKEVREKRSKN
jgi:hypothetical protein